MKLDTDQNFVKHAEMESAAMPLWMIGDAGVI